MEARSAETRDSLLLMAGVVFGLLVPSIFGLVGMSLAASGIAGLVFRGRIRSAAIAIAVGVTLTSVLWGAVQAVFTIPAVVAVVLAVVLLARIDVQWAGGLLTLIFSVAYAAYIRVTLLLEHLTNQAFIDQVVQSMKQGGQLTDSTPTTVRELSTLMVSLMPVVYFVLGFLTTVVVIMSVVWAANRSGRVLKVPPLGKLDLTPHVIWPFIAGLLALAASYGRVPYASELQMIGLGLLLCVRFLFALQGFGVSAGVLDRAGVGLGGRIFAIAALAVVDAFTLAVSLVGLVDFWINFRRLPRDGVTPQSPTAAMSDRS